MRHYHISLIALFTVFSFGGCQEDDENISGLSGTYEIVEYAATNCTDSTDDLEFTFTANGLCTTGTNGMSCIKITMNFINGKYDIETLVTAPNGDVSSNSDSGTYDVSSPLPMICFGDECNMLNVLNDGEMAIFTYLDEDDGCQYRLAFQRV